MKLSDYNVQELSKTDIAHIEGGRWYYIWQNVWDLIRVSITPYDEAVDLSEYQELA